MISDLTKRILLDCNLTQKQLAELLGVSVARVKRLSGGQVSKFSREEAEALISKLEIRADWLATGVGPMKQTPEEREFLSRLGRVSSATQRAGKLDLPKIEARRLQEILYAVEMGDKQLISQALNSALSGDEAQLVEHYRKCSPEARQIVFSMCEISAKNQGDK